MAAKKSSAGTVGTWVGVAVAIVGLYLTYKWLTKPRAQSGLSNGFVGGAYGGGAVSPYGGTSSSASNPLQSLLKGLQSLLNGKKSGGSGVSFGSGGGSGSPAAGLPMSLQNQIAAISGFSTIANNTPLAELGGYSLADYNPEGFDQSLIAGNSIPYGPGPSLFDLSGMAFSPADLGGSTDIPLDYGSGLDGLSIPDQPTQLFDLSGMDFGPGGDVATVPGDIGGPNLSDNFFNNDPSGNFFS